MNVGSKILTTVVSTFTSYYVHLWPSFFSGENQGLSPPLPSFDGRVVLYPAIKNIRDYLSWRQVDCQLLHADREEFLLRTLQVTSTTCIILHSGPWWNRAS